MAFNILNNYKNPFFYNKDSSVDSRYIYINDLSSYKPIYGSSVSFASRLNYIQTIDNSLKILPVSENNITAKFSLNFLLNNDDCGNLLKTLEAAGGVKYLKFKDPSGIYKEIIGLVEDYDVAIQSPGLNNVKIVVSSYIKSPIFNWRTSSFMDNITVENTSFQTEVNYKKYSFVYHEHRGSEKYNKLVDRNKMDNFWFAKNDTQYGQFSTTNWTKNFIYDNLLPFSLKNKFDFLTADYKNSFIENIKVRENVNVLKNFELSFDNIDDDQCKSMLFFLEKKCGYRRFIYEFPIFLKKHKVFICTQWSHVFKYKNNHQLNLTLIEDPNPNILLENDANGYYI